MLAHLAKKFHFQVAGNSTRKDSLMHQNHEIFKPLCVLQIVPVDSICCTNTKQRFFYAQRTALSIEFILKQFFRHALKHTRKHLT